MRTLFSLLSLGLCASPLAYAGERSSENVTFHTYSKFFRGDQVSQSFPADGYVSLSLKGDIDSEVTVDTSGVSELEWPTGQLVHSYSDQKQRGTVTLKTDLGLIADIHFDIAGVAGNFNLWERQDSWTTTQEFTGLLLPGTGTESVIATIDEALTGVFNLDYDQPLGYAIKLHLTGDLYPHSKVSVSGQSVKSNRKVFTSISDQFDLSAPNQSSGQLQMESRWNGDVVADFSADIVATITICEDYTWFGFCYDYPINDVWTLPSDARTLRSEDLSYALDIPGAVVTPAQITLGEVALGDSQEKIVSLSALSDAAIHAEAVLDSPVFSIVSPHPLSASGANGDDIRILFSPDMLGPVAATLVVHTNDPSAPTMTFDILGTGVEATLPPEDTSAPADTSADSGYVDGLDGSCQCGSVPSPSRLLWTLLPLLMLTTRRRTR